MERNKKTQRPNDQNPFIEQTEQQKIIKIEIYFVVGVASVLLICEEKIQQQKQFTIDY